MKKNIEPLDNFENQINDDSDILIEGDSNNVTINKHHKLSKTKIAVSLGGITLSGLAGGTAGYGIEHIIKTKELNTMEKQIIEDKTKYLTQLIRTTKDKVIISFLLKQLETKKTSYQIQSNPAQAQKEIKDITEILRRLEVQIKRFQKKGWTEVVDNLKTAFDNWNKKLEGWGGKYVKTFK